ncbi:MAG: tape measure protein [Alphaproteobacteria bacterium]|nr:tape measure protein [Alphaproteobacteria bacterium]
MLWKKLTLSESVRISKIKYEQQDAHVKAFYRNQDAQAKQALRLQQRDAAQSQAAQNRGFRVGVGAVAGQGFSVGGIASVNPYAAAGLAAAYAVKNVATDLVAEATVWEKFKVALTDIEGSAVKAAQATDDLYELAKRPGIGLKEAEQTYIQFRALNMEGAKAQKVIAAVSNAVALSGGGATEFQRVNYQITQMLSKGKVLEEDLRIMRNSLPRLTVAMRDAFGTTTAEGIRKAGVNAEQFLDRIVTQFEKLPKASQTLESATENAETAWSRLKASLVDTDKVKGSIEVWTSFLETLTDVVNAEAKRLNKILKTYLAQRLERCTMLTNIAVVITFQKILTLMKMQRLISTELQKIT